MHRGLHESLDAGGDDGPPAGRRHAEFMGIRLASKLQENWLLLAMVLAVPTVYMAVVGIRARLGSSQSGLPSNVMDLPTCTERLAALDLDFGDTGSMRLAVSKYAFDRKRVYDAMGDGVRHKGLTLGGVVTQGLKQADLFKITPDTRSVSMLITPILHPLEVPVRAMIVPLRDHVVAGKIRDAVRKLLMPVLPEGSIWLQDAALYHATLYHASSHAKPIHASRDVIAEEERSIRGVCGATCPIDAVLDRVVITATGVVVACWQVLRGGGEPALLRAALGAALPNAPPRAAQMVKEPAMLHTTIARLLQPPAPATNASGHTAHPAAALASSFAADAVGSIGHELLQAELSGTSGGGSSDGDSSSSHQQLQVGSPSGQRRRLLAEAVEGGAEAGSRDGGSVSSGGGGGGRLEKTESSSGGSMHVTEIDSEVVVAAVDALSATLCGLRAQFAEVWFIEEQDLLALALNGRYVRHIVPLSCAAPGSEELGGRSGRDILHADGVNADVAVAA